MMFPRYLRKYSSAIALATVAQLTSHRRARTSSLDRGASTAICHSLPIVMQAATHKR